jgi:PAS domain S-box-containing protein
LESTGDGIYGIDLEGRCTFINKAGAQMLGHRPDEVMGKDMHQLIHHSLPDGAAYPRVECRIYGAFKNQQSCHIDHEVFWRKDGTSFPVSYSSFPVVEQETITGAVVTFVDITERQRLEDERSRRAARLVKQQTALTALTQSRLFQTSELMSTLRHISAIAARTLGIERVSIWRFTGDRGSLQCIDLFELSHGRHSAGMSLSAASSPIYFAALASSPIIAADDVHTDERTRELSNSFLSPASINSMMDVPVYLFGKLEGAICHEHVGPIRHWSEDEQMFAVAMSNLVTLAYEQGERRWAEEQLRQSQEQLRNLTGRLESIQEEERIRISREVHDELGQELTGVKLELAFLRDQLVQSCPALLSRIEAITKQVDGTMQSVRKIATALRPVVLDQLGLLPAIEWQAGDFQAKTGITCTLNFYLRAVALPIERSTGVFRIFQEILTNVARHAGASHVDISVQEHKGHLLLSVIDNGRGITEEEVSGSKSLGLLGMRERALLLGGETKIERNPDRGTTVKLRIPMDPPTPDPADGDGEPFGQV